ncbi:MAG: carbohydrate ABC transporter permease [Nitratireductor sp.]|nr:carbohydrate ABC transporter permease [Nitratireductor sp.]
MSSPFLGSRKSRRKALKLFFTYVALATLVIVLLFPVLWILSISLKTRLQVISTPPLLIWTPTLDNYREVLSKGAFIPGLWNSLLVAGGSVLLSLGIGVPAAYSMARLRYAGKETIYYILLLMRMLPPIAVLIPMYMLFDALGIRNTRASVALAYTTFSLPVVVWVMRSVFQELPKEIEESATVDGASRWTTFVQIVLPLTRPGMVAVAILCLLVAWNDFLFASVLTSTATQTLPVLVASYSAFELGVEWGPLAAAGMLVITPVILVSILAQKHLVVGLSAGATKG